jgi:hypothetical protein
MTDEGTYSLEGLRTVAQSIGLEGGWTETVVGRAYEDQVCLQHACATVYNERVESGAIASSSCSVCGGRTRFGAGDHGVCVERAHVGIETPMLDTAATPCRCVPCGREPVGFTAPGVRMTDGVKHAVEAEVAAERRAELKAALESAVEAVQWGLEAEGLVEVGAR